MMKFALAWLCLFAHAYTAPNEERKPNGDGFHHQKIKDDVHHLLIAPESGTEIGKSGNYNAIPNIGKKSEDDQVDDLVKMHQDVGEIVVKDDPLTKYNNVDKTMEDRGHKYAQGNAKQASSDSGLKSILRAIGGTSNTATSNKNTHVADARSRLHHTLQTNASIITNLEKQKNPSAVQEGGKSHTWSSKGGDSDGRRFDWPHMHPSSNAGIISNVQDAGMSSGSGDYYLEESTTKERDVITQKYLHGPGRNDGGLSIRPSIEGGNTKAPVKHEEGSGNNPPKLGGTGITNPNVEETNLGPTNTATDNINGTGADCKKGCLKNIASICVDSQNSKNIRGLHTVSKNTSDKGVTRRRAGNIGVHSIQISRDATACKGERVSLPSQASKENDANYANRMQGIVGKLSQAVHKGQRRKHFQKQVKWTKRMFSSGHRNDESSSSSESSSESSESSRSDSHQSK
ncbi:uncharacterized protein [Ambystoma mexicanum]|uniref:uncharacterized protein n=1 Tax=Ambystoma mexicanum TaxID=8296 RepID=UPI0037E94018